MLVGYVAHPVSAPTAEGVTANVNNAKRWLAWLIANYEVAFTAPWIVWCEMFDDHDEKARAAGIAADVGIMPAMNMLFLVGGRLSTGMAAELAEFTKTAAIRVARSEQPDIWYDTVVDLTLLGYTPPTKSARELLEHFPFLAAIAPLRAEPLTPKGGF